MSERDDDQRDAWWTDARIWLIWFVAAAALTGVFHYRAQIRDLQRRVGQLESERR
jgi:hypothetical protein